MQRLREERGAVAVIVALLMVPLLGFCALAVDVASMWAAKQQLQSGADAGALAIAQSCGAGSCGNSSSTAQTFANDNFYPATGSATAEVTSLTTGSVTVTTSSVRQHLFGPVLGVNATTVTAKATVSWGTPTGGTAQLPLTFNKCEFDAQTGGGVPSDTIERTILFSKTSATSCTKYSNFVPGGFAWVKVNRGTCNTESAVTGVLSQLESDPGNSPPSSCSPADFAMLQNQTVLLPIFKEYGGNGNNAWYRVYGYAAFTITGYSFGGQFSWGNPCSGNDRCVRGYFTKISDQVENFTYGTGAPQLGAGASRLTE